jgi:hypothetical protein
MAKGKFPKVIYVKLEQDRDAEYIVADESPAGHAEIDKDVPVGVYRLERVAKVTAKAELE